jgi:hypothetical protein
LPSLFHDLHLFGCDEGDAGRRLLHRGAYLLLDGGEQFGILLQEGTRVFAPLPQARLAEAEPCARLLNDAQVERQIEQVAHTRDALAEDDVELRLSEGGATLFLTTLTRVRTPITSLPCLILSTRRTSRRTDAQNLSARPPGVVSGLPYITPTFSRIWFTNTTAVFVLAAELPSLRSACDISRACAPTVTSPISPSSS